MRKAREAFFHPGIQMIYIHTNRNKNGKPQLHIVAYQNGKKVSPEQARCMYDRMRKNQMQEMRHMRHMTGWVDDAPFIDMELGLSADVCFAGATATIQTAAA